MKGWQRVRGAWAVGLLVVLAAFGNRGAAQSWPMPACPAAYPRRTTPPTALLHPPQTADSPPSPLPLAPDGTPLIPRMPYAVGMPFAGPAPRELATPIVRLHVRAPVEVLPEKEIEYLLTVVNVSAVEAHHVTVRDRLPRGISLVRADPEPSKKLPPKDGVTDLLWDIGTLKGGQSKEIVVALQPGDAEETTNHAYVQFEHGRTIKTRIAKPSLALRIVVPPRNVSPHPIALRLEVTNRGSMPAKNVILKDELPDDLVFGNSKPELKGSEKPLIWKLGTLRPGQTRRVQLQVIPTKAGTFTNKVEVTAAGGVSRKSSTDLVVVGEEKAKISKANPRRPID